MNAVSKIGKFLIKFILSLVNVILLIIIILNLGVILSTRVYKADYVSLLDYTYYVVKNNNKDLKVSEKDLLLIDMRVVVDIDDLVMYRNDKGFDIGKVVEVDKNVKLSNDEVIPKNQVIGKTIQQFRGIGSIIEIILKPITLIISIALLTITTIIQNHINKKIKKENSKPNFNQTW